MKKTLTTESANAGECSECGDKVESKGYCKICYKRAYQRVVRGDTWDNPLIAENRDKRYSHIDEYSTPGDSLDNYTLTTAALSINSKQLNTVRNAIFNSSRGGVDITNVHRSTAVYAVLQNNERLNGAMISQHVLYENVRNAIYQENRKTLNIGLHLAPSNTIQCFEELPDMYREDCTDKRDFDELMVHCINQLKSLPMRNIEIFYWRSTTDATLEELGKLYGVTRERIRQLEEKAHKMLRRALSLSKPDTSKERLVLVPDNTLDQNRSILKSERAALRRKRALKASTLDSISRNKNAIDKAAIRKKIEYHTNLKDYFERMEQDL